MSPQYHLQYQYHHLDYNGILKLNIGKFNNINTDQELFSEICYHIILIEFVVECEKKAEGATQNYSPQAFVNVNNIGHVFQRKLTVRGEFNSQI